MNKMKRERRKRANAAVAVKCWHSWHKLKFERTSHTKNTEKHQKNDSSTLIVLPWNENDRKKPVFKVFRMFFIFENPSREKQWILFFSSLLSHTIYNHQKSNLCFNWFKRSNFRRGETFLCSVRVLSCLLDTIQWEQETYKFAILHQFIQIFF